MSANYDWALITRSDPAGQADPADPQCWWLLVRRHRHSGELAFYRCYSPNVVPLRELVRVAGRRWTVEESFQAGKGQAGLDEHQAALYPLLDRINTYLLRWIQKKYRAGMKQTPRRLAEGHTLRPKHFAHWTWVAPAGSRTRTTSAV